MVVALLLLIVIALVGLAAIRGTILQQHMAANQYDRQVAFQNAEAALVVAQNRILTDPTLIARDCQGGGVVCQGDPFSDPNLDKTKIVNVPASAGTSASATAFTVGTVSTGQPQYVIENMGNWLDPSSDTGYNQTANAAQYGAQGTSSTAQYYRITARSGDPDDVGDRAVVTLQAMVKQN
ncbi:PilX N-terminal domain-containing pilus assembly protein [Fulvimonas sp. R45]|uniref:pilus assembly PilX family protein n=1 Tax=Fulvimonas sp. R45 TaxID=3045937 RepID=UPI00265FD03F|nr:PilX N-terminal domain-containing pilus assembly protein [Fulvimonas sp. R45]MDO1527501.1 PilX N-terminal domain-containing pilus assembly protein [Fulvimonas sp. R45]